MVQKISSNTWSRGQTPFLEATADLVMAEPISKCRIKIASTGKVLMVAQPSSSTIEELIKAICKREKLEFSSDFKILEDDAELWSEDLVGHVIVESKAFVFQGSSPGNHSFS